MMITLKDNTKEPKVDDIYLPTLKKYSHKSLNKLLRDNDELILFSDKLDNEDFYKKQTLWDIRDDEIYTNNIMGFVGLPNCNVRITSRFTNDDKDYFLHYMLQKVFLGQIINLDSNTSEDSVWNFYYYLFPYYLNKALSLGLYKEYIYKKYNNINMHGAIDVKRHIQKNIPFQGNIAYNTREHSYNNRITQLVRHTSEHIKQSSFGSILLNSSTNTRESVEQIEYLTTDYHHSKRQSIITQCHEKISNPYWQHYEVLRKLCIKILTNEKLSFSGSHDKVHGILFDGSWLWEEYLNTFLSPYFIHSDNKNRKNAIYLAEKNTFSRYPDFYSTLYGNQKAKIVLDAKYKHYKDYRDVREDTHQIISYMYALKSERGILVYPSIDNKESECNLKGYGCKFIHTTHIIADDKNISFDEFSNKMRKNEEMFIDKSYLK